MCDDCGSYTEWGRCAQLCCSTHLAPCPGSPNHWYTRCETCELEFCSAHGHNDFSCFTQTILRSISRDQAVTP